MKTVNNSPAKRKNRKLGATLAEMLIAAAILGIVSGSLITALTEYNKQRNRITTLGSMDVQISGLVENVRSNLHLYQASYESYDRGSSVNVADRLMPDAASLPLAWSPDGAISNPESCPRCQGRLGMIIQPLPTNFDGAVYLITLRVSHPELRSGQPTDYRFLGTFKE